MIDPSKSTTLRRLILSKGIPVSLLGKRYVIGGRGPRDYDCWGIVLAFFRASGIEVPDPRSQRMEDIKGSGIFEHFIRVVKPDFGDVAVFDTDATRHHVGIVTLSGILHATQQGVGIFPVSRCNIREYYRHREAVSC